MHRRFQEIEKLPACLVTWLSTQPFERVKPANIQAFLDVWPCANNFVEDECLAHPLEAVMCLWQRAAITFTTGRDIGK